MGFGGGGSAGMTNHVHNNVPLQGGPLDFANDTIASLNAGSTTFSDGAALQELVIGNPADVLKVNGGGTAPEWAAAGGATVSTASDELAGTFTSTSLTFVDITGWTLTKPNIAGGECMTVAYCSCDQDGNVNVTVAIEDNGSVTSLCETMRSNVATSDCGPVCVSDISDTDGNTIQMQGRGFAAGTWKIKVDGSYTVPKVTCFGVG